MSSRVYDIRTIKDLDDLKRERRPVDLKKLKRAADAARPIAERMLREAELSGAHA